MANWTDNGYGSASERVLGWMLSRADWRLWIALGFSLATLTLKSLGMFS